ncbi:MAG: tRNA (adenosine(37)-N6)-threonylcarbamoyltransferase complex ATPase subunit type 1 TsaE [Candidatus Liptonbacteria bacterium]|nr:tRNA (adenosine(37)-N6)-threonylcarbamoyltransferase complex ATPase subunit type 1 TsaE [Candidatus Liptonbacteria bacterium]
MKTYRSFSSTETERLGYDFGRKILRKKPKASAIILGLQGALGSGKTVFAKGLFRALGVRARILSPTFLLIKSYELKKKNFKQAYHFDCYRIKNEKELRLLGAKEILAAKENLVLIEWADRLKSLRGGKNVIKVKLYHGLKSNERIIKIPNFLSR